MMKYQGWLIRAMIKAGVRGVGRMYPPSMDKSETDLQVAREHLAAAVARAECNGARAKIRAMMIAKGSE